jgi:hypothetical protein
MKKYPAVRAGALRSRAERQQHQSHLYGDRVDVRGGGDGGRHGWRVRGRQARQEEGAHLCPGQWWTTPELLYWYPVPRVPDPEGQK